MSPPTIVRPDARRRTRRSVTLGVAGLAAALAVVAGLTFIVGLSDSPASVPRITFVNPTEYSLHVEVSREGEGSRAPAGFVRKRSTTVVEEVPDQGDVWVFRFDGQGAPGGELRRTREQLAGDGWRVEIPVEVGERLARAGAPPTP